MGERKNPVSFDSKLTTEYVQYTHKNQSIGFTMELSNLMRGEEAVAFAKQMTEV